MNKSIPWMVPLLLSAAAAFQAAAQTAPPRDVPFAGTLKIDVDATDLPHRIFRVRTTIPATPGPLTLLYPQWIPGNHSPTGPIDKLAGLVIKANGKVLPWTRDQFDVYAFKIEVPAGVTEIVAEYQFLSSQGNREGRVMMTPEMLNLQWNTTALYPAGVYARNIMTQASVTLPSGWSYATALETATRSGDTVTFKPINLEDLVDSPMYAGKYYKRIVLDAKSKAPVALNVFADKPKALEVKPEQVKAHAELVQQMDKLYGARHFDHYEFLLALTEKLGGIGLEHHRSSENSGPLDYFTEWNQSWQMLCRRRVPGCGPDRTTARRAIRRYVEDRCRCHRSAAPHLSRAHHYPGHARAADLAVSAVDSRESFADRADRQTGRIGHQGQRQGVAVDP